MTEQLSVSWFKVRFSLWMQRDILCKSAINFKKWIKIFNIYKRKYYLVVSSKIFFCIFSLHVCTNPNTTICTITCKWNHASFMQIVHIFLHCIHLKHLSTSCVCEALQWSPVMTVIILGSSQRPIVGQCCEKCGCTQLSVPKTLEMWAQTGSVGGSAAV